MLPFFFCVSGGGVQIRARTRAPSWEGGTSFCHTRATAGKFTRGGQRRGSAGRSPLTCRARTLKVHRREPPGTARVCCGPLRRARLPPPSRPQRFNHRIRTTTALWCVRNPRRFFSPACGITPRGDVLAGSLRPPERRRSTVAQNRKLSRGLALLRPSSAPLALIAGGLIARDISETSVHERQV